MHLVFEIVTHGKVEDFALQKEFGYDFEKDDPVIIHTEFITLDGSYVRIEEMQEILDKARVAGATHIQVDGDEEEGTCFQTTRIRIATEDEIKKYEEECTHTQ